MVSPANDPSSDNQPTPEGGQPENPLDSSAGASGEVVATSFSDQSYTSKYGSRFRNISLGLFFELEERVLKPIDGGDLDTYKRDIDEQMSKIESAINARFDEGDLRGEFESVRFLGGLQLLQTLCTAKGADALLEIAADVSNVKLSEDSTGMYMSTSEALHTYHTIWENGSHAPHFTKIQTLGIDHYVFIFQEGQAVPDAILSEIEAVLQDNDLVGAVGVNLACSESGRVILTCRATELALFTEVAGLTKIELIEDQT